MADFDLDRKRKIFVSYGYFKDVRGKDVALRIRQPEVKRSIFEGVRVNYNKYLQLTPSVPRPNYLFKNLGNLRFEDRAEEWVIGEPNLFNGAAYGDLDNDGDLHLIVNNVNDEPFVYRDQVAQRRSGRHWLQIALDGASPNA